VSINFSYALFPVLDFLTLEDGNDRLSRNVGAELPHYTTKYPRKAQIAPDDLAMQAMVWLRTVWLRVIYFDAVWFGTL
jgi:hypothetical protein